MPDDPQVFVAIPKRPLLLANLLREKQSAISSQGKVVSVPRTVFGGAVPIVLDGVSDWWSQQGKMEWPDSSLRATWRLPWRHVWAEYRDYFDGFGWRGFMLREHSLRPGHVADDLKAVLFSFDGTAFEQADRFVSLAAPLASVCVTGTLFMKHDSRDLPTIVGSIAWAASADGRAIGEKGLDGNDVAGVTDIAASESESGEVLGLLACWTLFTALMRVKHLGVADVQLSRPERRNFRRHTTDGLPPWVSYKTLAIKLPRAEPVPFGVATHRPSPGVPFHLVRGHLADYSKGPGLFGRWKQVVWRPAHHRGFQQLGVIAKGYSADVKADRL